MGELTFVDELPPSGSRGGSSHQVTAGRAAELQANPGKWAPWPTKSGASTVKKALARYGAGFEITTRPVDGKGKVFVRFVAPADTPPVATRRRASLLPPTTVDTTDKIKCNHCGQFITVNSGEGPSKALIRHFGTNQVCEAMARRRR